ncbi:hypothetical protein RIF29_38363 [Crotalaria pallida]|uniref:Uncharacterized protein n=1 Tax=Crotalaria pallida TaxID=3830 RepID=A0AAN9E012_CROPI
MSSSQNCSKNDRKRSSNWETSSTFDSATSYSGDFGVRVVLRTAPTQEHYGLRFWGCRFYKVNNVLLPFTGDDVVREKEMMIMKRKMEMESIRRDLDSIK